MILCVYAKFMYDNDDAINSLKVYQLRDFHQILHAYLR